MKDKLHNILSQSDCPSADVLKKYLKGQLSKEESRKVELHLAECEMCSDELEGLSLMQNETSLASITVELNSEIDKRTGQKKGLVVPFNRKAFAAVAAVLLVGVVITTYFLTKRNINSSKEIAQKEVYKEPGERNENKKPPVPVIEKTITGNGADKTKNEEGLIAQPLEKEADRKGNIKKTIAVVEDEMSIDMEEDIVDATVAEPAGAFATTISNSGTTNYTFDLGNQELSEGQGYVVTNYQRSFASTSQNSFQNKGALSGDTLKWGEFHYSRQDSITYRPQNQIADNIVVTEELAKIRQTESTAVTVSSVEKNGLGLFDKKYKEIKMPVNEKKETELAEAEDFQEVELENEENKVEPTLNQAIVQYNDNDNVNSIITLNSILETNPKDEASLYYLGLNYQANSQDEEAINNYDKVIELKGKNYFDKAKYQKALILIKQKKYSEAKTLLDEVIKSNDDLKLKADSLLLIIKK